MKQLSFIKKYVSQFVLFFCTSSTCFAHVGNVNNITDAFKANHETKQSLPNSQDWLASDSSLHISGGIDPVTGKSKDILLHSQSTVDQLQSKYGVQDMWLKFKVDLE